MRLKIVIYSKMQISVAAIRRCFMPVLGGLEKPQRAFSGMCEVALKAPTGAAV